MIVLEVSASISVHGRGASTVAATLSQEPRSPVRFRRL